MMLIRKAANDDIDIVTKIASLLYDEHIYDELYENMRQILKSLYNIVFLAFDGDKNIGFAHCSIRHDYVEGTDSENVGYLEGIYVLDDHRHKGIARALVESCENWARGYGCKEFASDCEMKNTDSYNFHLKVGFDEANRIICFTKKLD
ncbi:MAG: aminoglycoside 6'-N-acetyltransferase [Saccharofermentanales bacterium]